MRNVPISADTGVFVSEREIVDAGQAQTWGNVAAWVAAAISVTSAALSVWWPWHTRSESKLEHERVFFHGTAEQLGSLIVTCDFVRPILFVQWRNNGDGVAHDVRIRGEGCEVKIVAENESSATGYDWPNSIPRLAPGEGFQIIVLPPEGDAGEQPIPLPKVLVEWAEEPTRLSRSKKRMLHSLPYQLPARIPLAPQEKELAMDYVTQMARRPEFRMVNAEHLLRYIRVDARRIDLGDYR